MTVINATFDHALVGVADLEAARAAYRRLGFTVCPRGRHIGWGTANYCIMFADDYLELLGIVDAGQFTNDLDTFLKDHGQGLLGMSFASDDVEALAKKIGGRPDDLKRLLELPEGALEPRFRLLHPAAGAMPGLSGFFCQHLTPQLLRRPAWLVHANGAVGIHSATIAVADMAAAERAYGRIFGAAAGPPAASNGGGLRIVQSEANEGLIQLAVRVSDAAAATGCLERAGVTFIRTVAGLAIAPAEACGAAITLVF